MQAPRLGSFDARRQTAFLRRFHENYSRGRFLSSRPTLLVPPSAFHFAWDPSNNPEQARLRRAALIAGGVGLGAAVLGAFGHRRGWFKPVPFKPRTLLPFTPSAPGPRAVAPIRPPAPYPAPAPSPAVNPPTRNAAASAELRKLVAKMKVMAGPSKPPSSLAASSVVSAKRSAPGPAGDLPSSAVGHLAALHHAAQHGPNAAARRAAADTHQKLKEKHGIVHTVPVAARKPTARLAPDPFRKPNRIIEDTVDRPGGRVARHGSVAEETERQMAARFRALFLEDTRNRIEFFGEQIQKVAAVEMLPFGTAIHAACLAGVRTGIAFRRLNARSSGVACRRSAARSR